MARYAGEIYVNKNTVFKRCWQLWLRTMLIEQGEVSIWCRATLFPEEEESASALTDRQWKGNDFDGTRCRYLERDIYPQPPWSGTQLVKKVKLWFKRRIDSDWKGDETTLCRGIRVGAEMSSREIKILLVEYTKRRCFALEGRWLRYRAGLGWLPQNEKQALNGKLICRI